MVKLVGLWCRLYTMGVPAAVRDRRRDEIAAHVWDASASGLTGSQVMLGAVVGAADDLRWCRHERERAGLAPMLYSATGSVLVGGTLLLAALALSFSPDLRRGFLPPALVVLAVTFVGLSWLDRAIRGRPGTRRPYLPIDRTPIFLYQRAVGGIESRWTRPASFYRVAIPALVVAFAVSSVGGDRTPSDGGMYWIGATGWTVFGLAFLGTLTYTVALAVRRVRHRTDP